MRALEFFYVNHKGEHHKYKVIPISIAYDDTELYAGKTKAWVMKALVLERSAVVRNVIRTFALVRMNQVAEASLETG